MLSPGRWAAFLADRGVDLLRSEVARLDGGEVNDNFKIADHRQARVLRHYRDTLDPAEIDCELAAVDILARSGFPTPAPVPATSTGRLWELIDHRPAALFTFAAGDHPAQRVGGYGSMDRDLGRQTASLAARLGAILVDHDLPGRRSPARDAWRRIDDFLTGELVAHPIFDRLRTPLRDSHQRLARVYEHPALELPIGLIHNDLTPANLLVDATGDVTAVLDFDDSVQTFLAYELGAVISSFGRDAERHIDLGRVRDLTAAYDAVRPLTATERDLLPDLMIAHHAAEGIHVLSNWLAAGRQVASPLESYSAQAFLELADGRDELRSVFATPA